MDNDQLILKQFIAHHSEDAARIIEQLKIEHSLALIEKIPVEIAVTLFKEMGQFAVVRHIERMEVEHAIKIIEKFSVQLNASILRKVNSDVREIILAKLSPEISLPLNQMLSLSVNSVGTLMNPLVPTLPDDISIKDALDLIRKNKQQLFHYIYIIRHDNIFAGLVKLEDLIVTDSKEQLVSIMKTDVPHLIVDIDFHKIINHPGWIDYNALPVLDRSGVFVGTLSYGVLMKLEIDKNIKRPQQAVLAGNALGELYWIGLSGLLYSAEHKVTEQE
jgi:magnesium transporter